MTFLTPARVSQTTASPGTGGPYDLGAAATNFRAFRNAYADGTLVPYCRAGESASYEIGYGTLTFGATDTITPTVVLASSNANALVNWPAGISSIFAFELTGAAYPRQFSGNLTPSVDDWGNLLVYTGAGGHTLTVPALATVPLGFAFEVLNGGTGALSFALTGADTWQAPGISYSLVAGSSFRLVKGVTGWAVEGYVAPTGGPIPISSVIGLQAALDSLQSQIDAIDLEVTTLDGTVAALTVVVAGKQAASPILDGVVALAAGTGLTVKTAASSFAVRTLTGTMGQITVTNGDGIAGNPTVSLPSAILVPGTLEMTGVLSLASGAVGAPGLAFTAEAGTGLWYVSTGQLGIAAAGVGVALFRTRASAVNYWELYPAAAGNSPTINVAGTDTNITAQLASKGTGDIELIGNGLTRLRIAGAGVSTALLTLTPPVANTGGTLSLGITAGSATQVDFTLAALGAGSKHVFTAGGLTVAEAQGVASAVNFLRLVNAVTGAGPEIAAQGTDTNISVLLRPAGTGTVKLPTGTGLEFSSAGDTLKTAETALLFAISDETTAITTGTAKITIRAPFAMTLTQIPRASLTTASSSGNPTFDINVGGVSILGANKLSIDSGETTSVDATTPTTLVTTSIASNDVFTVDVDVAGTGAAGAKIYLYYRRT